jgi:hypothetical protein
MKNATVKLPFFRWLTLTRQTSPSFGSSAVDDSSARFGCHTFAKAVVAGPFNSTGLKCSFHFANPLFIYIWHLNLADAYVHT